MNLVFQVVCLETGRRSRAMQCTREKMASALSDLDSEVADGYGLLVLMEGDEDEVRVSEAPIMKVSTFTGAFAHG